MGMWLSSLGRIGSAAVSTHHSLAPSVCARAQTLVRGLDARVAELVDEHKDAVSTGLTRVLETSWRTAGNYPATGGGSSLARGRMLDDDISAFIDNYWSRRQLGLKSDDLHPALRSYIRDIEDAGWIPIATQLPAWSTKGNVITAGDDLLLGPDGIIYVERKSGFRGDIHAPLTNQGLGIKTACTDTFLTRHMLQAVLTARMIEQQYALSIVEVYVVYNDRTWFDARAVPGRQATWFRHTFSSYFDDHAEIERWLDRIDRQFTSRVRDVAVIDGPVRHWRKPHRFGAVRPTPPK